MGRIRGRLLTAVAVGLLALAVGESDDKILKFSENGSFKIVQFTDLHYGDSALDDVKTGQAMLEILKAEKDVNLVIFTGDMISDYACPHKLNTPKSQAERAKWFDSMWSKVISPVQKRQVKYAAVLGNHDASQTKSARKRSAELDISTGRGFSFTQIGPDNITGVSNYFLPIQSSKTSKESARLWLFDSMVKGCNNLDYSWGCVGEDTVHWFEGVASKVESPLPGAAFVHIPLPEFLEGWWADNGSAKGARMEAVSCPRANTHLFDKLRLHGVTSVYSGHDHLNDFVVVYKGIRLAYGQKSGYGSYGPSGLAGARVIVLKEGQATKDAETYVRFADGTRDDQPERKSSIKGFQFRCAAGPYIGNHSPPKLLSTAFGGPGPRYSSASITMTLVVSFIAAFGLLVWRRRQRSSEKLREDIPNGVCNKPDNGQGALGWRDIVVIVSSAVKR